MIVKFETNSKTETSKEYVSPIDRCVASDEMSKFSDVKARNLEATLTKKEIREWVSGCGNEKALGRESFNVRSIKKFRGEIMTSQRAMGYVQQHGHMLDSGINYIRRKLVIPHGIDVLVVPSFKFSLLSIPKLIGWVTAIKESKDLSTLSLDELFGNLKVCEVVLEKDLEVSKNMKEKYKSPALKARQVLSEKHAARNMQWRIRDFKRFFRRRGKFVRQPYDDKKNFRKAKEDKKEKEYRRCFKCGDPNHFISDCPKHSFGDQKGLLLAGC
ncbi:zf-CCHC domain-containing protein [Tanacetum coccineum]